jgi:hypothetical protein
MLNADRNNLLGGESSSAAGSQMRSHTIAFKNLKLDRNQRLMDCGGRNVR